VGQSGTELPFEAQILSEPWSCRRAAPDSEDDGGWGALRVKELLWPQGWVCAYVSTLGGVCVRMATGSVWRTQGLAFSSAWSSVAGITSPGRALLPEPGSWARQR